MLFTIIYNIAEKMHFNLIESKFEQDPSLKKINRIRSKNNFRFALIDIKFQYLDSRTLSFNLDFAQKLMAFQTSHFMFLN